RLTNACGDDLGVFSVCDGGKECVDGTAGADASCGCVPTSNVVCAGAGNLYDPSGITTVDSCGIPSSTWTETCEDGERCILVNGAPQCRRSLSDDAAEGALRGCLLTDMVRYQTDLAVDCRCRRHGINVDMTPLDMSGNPH